MEEMWSRPKDQDAGDRETPTEGWAARMAEHERQRAIDPLDKVARPTLGRSEWSGRLGEIRADVTGHTQEVA